MIIGRKFFAHSYIILCNGKTVYIKESLEKFLDKFLNEKNDEIVCHVAHFLKKETISISRNEIYHYGRIFINR